MIKLSRVPYIASLLLLAYMPFHIFLSQSVSLVTGGLEAWKIGKDVFLVLACLFTICLVYAKRKGNRSLSILLGLTFLYGVFHLVLWAFNPDIYGRSAILGVIYNMRLPLFAILGYGSVLLLPKFVFSSVIKVVLIASTIVAFLGVVQFVLPGDILSHLGYSVDRGVRAAFYIDDNTALPLRIMSTLREPNALGAYLILPATAFGLLALRESNKNRRLVFTGVFVLQSLAILLTFSRSAWLGFGLSLFLVVWWQYNAFVAAFLRRFWSLLATLVVVLSVGVFSVSNTDFFQQYIIHGNSSEQVQDLDSNDYHKLLVKRGLEGIVEKPFGHGPGTAGLASIQNPSGGQLTENYYVQIGYEIGILGVALFCVLNAWIYIKIWSRRDYVALVLCASFWGYVLTNMLLHTWSNEAVAAQWWILAGMALSARPKTTKNVR
ncbi:MAG TPA: O-antigen ligase family protein [Candidatus Saccharimonadales bacterium]